MVSEKEVEAAREVLERRVFDEGGCEAQQVPAMVREMLQAAALARAEANAGEPRMVDLKPCPFCGGNAEELDLEDEANFGGSVICCQKCGASSPVHFDRKENLYDSWNRRTEAKVTEASELCPDCQGSGYSNHPDSGQVCYRCNGQGSYTHPAQQPSDRLVQFLYRLCRDHGEIDFEAHVAQTKHGPAVYSSYDIECRARGLASDLTHPAPQPIGPTGEPVQARAVADALCNQLPSASTGDASNQVLPAVKVHPADTLPSGSDHLITKAWVHEGCLIALYGTNDKLIGWIDTHDWLKDKVYRDRLLSGKQKEDTMTHPDDEAVDKFAAAMKAKLKWERENRDRNGWNDPSLCSDELLVKLLIDHLPKGNDGNYEDIANLCMMLYHRDIHPSVLAEQLHNLRSVTKVVEALWLFREFVIKNATQWKLGSNHHHPIWMHVAEALGDVPEIRRGPEYQFIQPLNERTLGELRND